MSNVTYAFLLSSLAGLSTMLGTLLLGIKGKDKDNIIASSLAFAAGVMICVSMTDLIPESKMMLDKIFKPFPACIIFFVFFTIGIIFSIIIDKFFP